MVRLLVAPFSSFFFLTHVGYFHDTALSISPDRLGKATYDLYAYMTTLAQIYGHGDTVNTVGAWSFPWFAVCRIYHQRGPLEHTFK